MKPRKFTIHTVLRTLRLHVLGIRLGAVAQKEFRTANTTRQEDLRLSAVICTANIAAIPDGGWGVVAPYGVHPSPDGKYVQVFRREQAEKVVQTWNSLTGTAARVFKNLWHGLGGGRSLPVWDGHPETDKSRWPKEKLLAEITDLRAGEDGLEGCVTWNARGQVKRTKGPLFPSPLWWHWPPAGDPPSVFPELLESIGLVPTPNISGVPAWTANANPLASQSEAEPQQETKTENTMNKQRIIELLGLDANATDEQIENALKAQGPTANALQTANAAKTETETKLTEANSKLTTANTTLATVTTERDTLKTANGALSTEVEALRTGVLNVLEKRGIISPAQRDETKTALTANAAETLVKLETKKQELNTERVEINGNRIDLSTANARAAALEGAINKYMADNKCDRDTAFTALRADSNFAPLFGAMQDPTRKAA